MHYIDVTYERHDVPNHRQRDSSAKVLSFYNVIMDAP